MKRQTRNNLISVLLVLLILAALALFGYRAYQEENQPQNYQLILIPKALDNTNGFWTSLISGARLGAKEFGAQLEILGVHSEENVEGQKEKLKEAIAKKPDAILIAPGSYAEMTDTLKEAVAKHIKVILIDSVVDETVGSSIVATDNIKAGEELGRYTTTLLDANAKIAMIGHVAGVSTAVDRERGMRKGLGEYADNVREVIYGGYTYDTAYRLTRELLQRQPDINVIMGMNEYSSVGAARAVKDLGLAKKIKMVGFDNSVEEIQLLEQGVFSAIVIQKPVNMGYLGVEQAVKVLDGKSVDPDIDSGSKLITHENMYEEENQRLLYPFSG